MRVFKKKWNVKFTVENVKIYKKKKGKKRDKFCLLFAFKYYCGGAGGIRTRVRTKRHNAFYMLIRRLGFRAQCWFGDQPVCTLAP